MNPFLSAIFPFAFDFAPRGWAICAGQLMSIAQNSALFSLLGTTYGGDGRVTFGLPDLRGRAPMHFGQGLGLPNVSLGEVSGIENVNLISTQIPQHNHMALVNNSAGIIATPAAGNSLAELTDINGDGANFYGNAAENTVLNPATVSNAGGNQPHSNMQPYLVVNYCIALQGLFPSRN